MRASRLQLTLILLVLGLLLTRESREGSGFSIERDFVDWLMSNATRASPPAALTLVEINDSSLQEGHTWPWSPLDYALFVQAAIPFKPRLIAIEEVLSWDATNDPESWQTKHPQYEKILHDFLLRAPQVLIAAQLGFPDDPDVVPPMQPVSVLRHVMGDARAIPEFTAISRQPKEELRLWPKLGFANLPLGETPIRTAPLLLRYRGEVVPSFVLQAVMLFQGIAPDSVRVHVGSDIDLGGNLRIPIDATGAMRVYFKAPYTQLGADDLLLAAQKREEKPQEPLLADGLTRSITLLARTDADSRTLEFPSGVRGSSGQLAAAATATILANQFIQRLPMWAEVAVLGALLLLGAFLPGWPRRLVLQVALAVAVGYLLIALAVFSWWLVWLPLVMPIGVLVFAVLFHFCAPRRAELRGA